MAQVAPMLGRHTPLTLRQRQAIATGAGFLALWSAIGGVTAFKSEAARPYVQLGFGRIAALWRAGGYPGGHLLVALEHLHFAMLMGWFCVLLAFGRSQPPRPLIHEHLVMHRQEGARAEAPGAVMGIVGLIVTSRLAAAIHPLAAGVLEVSLLTLLARAGWRAAVPESRRTLSVFVDGRHGWANRLVIGGPTGRLFIRHEQLQDVSVREPPIVRLLQLRDLKIGYSDAHGDVHAIVLHALGPELEVVQLAAFLNTGFKRALSPRALDSLAGRGRAPNDVY